MRAIMIALLLAGCSGPEGRDTAVGIAAGAGEFAKSMGDAVSALETGGWTAGAVLAILGAIKGISVGFRTVKNRRIARRAASSGNT